jgi:hypothetical protein
MIKITGKVHSLKAEPVAVDAKLGERAVKATVPGLVLEIVHEGHGHTFRHVPASDADHAAAIAAFVPGAQVEISIAVKGDAQ